MTRFWGLEEIVSGEIMRAALLLAVFISAVESKVIFFHLTPRPPPQFAFAPLPALCESPARYYDLLAAHAPRRLISARPWLWAHPPPLRPDGGACAHWALDFIGRGGTDRDLLAAGG